LKVSSSEIVSIDAVARVASDPEAERGVGDAPDLFEGLIWSKNGYVRPEGGNNGASAVHNVKRKARAFRSGYHTIEQESAILQGQ
jgi:hypothetical protein